MAAARSRLRLHFPEAAYGRPSSCVLPDMWTMMGGGSFAVNPVGPSISASAQPRAAGDRPEAARPTRVLAAASTQRQSGAVRRRFEHLPAPSGAPPSQEWADW